MLPLAHFVLCLPLAPLRLVILLGVDFPACDLEFLEEADSGNCLLAHLLQTQLEQTFSVGLPPHRTQPAVTCPASKCLTAAYRVGRRGVEGSE